MRLKQITLLTFVLIVGLGITGCSAKNTVPYQNTDFAMGTVIHQTIYGKGGEAASVQIMDMLKEVENKQLSWRSPDSSIAKINENAGGKELIPVDELLYEWMDKSLELARNTDGAIDPTVGPISKLWDIGGDNQNYPGKQAVSELLPLVDYKDIVLKPEGILLKRSNQSLDLGALGKGIGADEALKLLVEEPSIEGAVISVGGSILMYGNKPDKSPWKVGIQDPRAKEGETMGVISSTKSCNVSTSGDYEKYFMRKGKRYHHIMNPKTGFPSDSDIISVTIISDSGMLSDGLSTACMILGYEKSLPILKQYNAKALFVDKDKKIYMTEGMEKNFTLTAKGYTIVKK